MNTLIKIAWRNILRNKKRSLITLSAVGFGLGALIFIWSFVDGAHKQMIENYTSQATSHVQIHKKGFHQSQKLEKNIQDPQQILKQLKDNTLIKASSLRIKAVGLVSSSESSAGVMIIGIQPEEEKELSSLYRRIKEGEFIDSTNTKDIVIGRSLAQNLNVTIGDKLVIMSQATDGSIAAGAFYVRGLLDTGAEEIDKGVVLINFSAAQELFVMTNAASEIALKTPEANESYRIARLLEKDLNNPGLEVMSWEEVSPSFKQWIEFDNGFIWLIVIVVMIVVAIGILNTVLMGVLERTREFGILLALGIKPKEIVWMVAWESFFLGILGSIFGLVLGGALTLYFSKMGIDLSFFTSALNSFYIDSIVYPQMDQSHIIISLVLILLTSLIVSIYPALHASRLKPIDAIRSY